MRSPKPKHEVTAGHVRITLIGGTARSPAPATLTLERRRDCAAEAWYPAASFQVGELAELEQAVRDMKAFIEVPSTRRPPERPTTPDTSPKPEVEQPPFEPTDPAAPPRQSDPSPMPTGDLARPTRKSKSKRPVRQVHAKAKTRSR